MIEVKAEVMAAGLKMPWRNCIAVGRAYELLRADVLEHLRFLQRSIGYRYCRFHGIFHDDVGVVVRRPDGVLQYQWHQVDKIYDALLGLGLRPFVELNPMPMAMASGSATIFHWKMNVTPPRRMGEWEELIRAFVVHLVERYGVEEVRQWYFEVWNEPNLPGFWTGSQAEYFELYDASARAVKGVDARLRVGGPATSKASWIGAFISHCAEAKVAVDFVSTHLYPQDEFVIYPEGEKSPHAAGEFFGYMVREATREVRESELPTLPIHWTEWNAMSAASAREVSWSRNPTNDSLYGAAFVVRNMLALDDAAETFCWWTASDVFEEGGMPHAAFSGTYGLLTIHGMAKAACNAFVLLKRMRGNVMRVTGEFAAGRGGFATLEAGVWHLMFWHWVGPGEKGNGVWRERVRVPVGETSAAYLAPSPGTPGEGDFERKESLDIRNHPHPNPLPEYREREPEGRMWDVSFVRIRRGAGSCYETWCEMGRPQNLTVGQEAMLRGRAEPECRYEAVGAEGGVVEISIELGAGEVVYLEMAKRGASAAPKGAVGEEMARWEKAMGAVSTRVALSS